MKLLPTFSLLLFLFSSCISEDQADLSLQVAEYQDEILGNWLIKDQTCSGASIGFQDTIRFFADGNYIGNFTDGNYWVNRDLEGEVGVNLYLNSFGFPGDDYYRIIELTEDELVLYVQFFNDDFCVYEYQRL
ncbi:MAG: hypothetical protein AAGH79_08230 [Bacteroidota bacterium]